MEKKYLFGFLCSFLGVIAIGFACARPPVPPAPPENLPTVLESFPTPPPTPAPTPFSFVWLADTQSMSYYDYPGALASMGHWIAEQRKDRNILYVLQTGDAVDEGWVPRQWEHFDQLYNSFKDLLPYFSIAGNHDVGIKWHGYEPYLERPNVRNTSPEQSFEKGRAVYATVHAGGMDFLLLGAGWESELDAAGWMNTVLQEHPNDIAILLFHGYINADGTFTRIGKQMFEQVVRPNPNVRLVLSGHVRGTGYRLDELDDSGDGIPDRSVNSMIYNYQHYGENCGQLRILTFDPLVQSIEVTTYSPYMDRFYKDDYFKSETFFLEQSF